MGERWLKLKKTMSNVELKLLASKAAIKLPTNKSDNGYYSIVTQNKEGILPVATLNVTQLTVLRHRFTFLEAEVYNKSDNNFVLINSHWNSDQMFILRNIVCAWWLWNNGTRLAIPRIQIFRSVN